MRTRDPFTVIRPAGSTNMIAYRGRPILACDDENALTLCALLNSGYNLGIPAHSFDLNGATA